MSLRRTCGSIALALVFTTAGALATGDNQQQHPGTSSSVATGTTTPANQRMPMMGHGMMRQGGMMGPDMMAGQGMMGQGGMCDGAMGQMGMMSDRAGHVEGRIAFLKAELKITDEQLPLWNAVADSMRANANSMTQTCYSMMDTNQNASLPDRLAAREKMLSARLDAVRKLKAAVGPLYAALGDDQKETADQIMTGMGPGMDMGMGRMGMGMRSTKTP